MARLVIDMPTELHVRSDPAGSEPQPCMDDSVGEESLPPDVRWFLSWFACWSPISR
ncbi:hypothetical protein [Halapricum desulfuricans]|uniref:Uncharacterized protein n=1 Tax=Halapricum desulfuricans TaxID=2841257 RepID=A0A897MZX5_9EURY|nr:hypothetical protein [Halapricum desulfuricans]QSG05997.1 hypothetical protein HSR121_1660 [Halapricum desulfuricans]